MDAVQAQMAQLMATEAHGWCAMRGLSRARSLTLVLYVNAWGESKWKPDAKQPGGLGGRGLFQCDVIGGLGKVWMSQGFPESDLYNPTINTRLILWEAGRSKSFVESLTNGTIGQAIHDFVYYVERPYDKPGDTAERQAFAKAFAKRDDINSILCRTFG